VAIKIRDKNGRCFLCGPRRHCLLDNCVVTRLYNSRVAVFSVLRGPCPGYVREQNSEARAVGVQKSTRSTTELSVGESHGKFVVEKLEVGL
jgi:hypothetical protein